MAADARQLVGMVDQAIETMDARPAGVLADTGYYSDENVKAMAARGIEAFIPARRVTHAQWRQMESESAGPPPLAATARERMEHKLRTPEGRARYDRRKETVEPTFGQIKQVQGLRQVLLRGRDKVRSMWRFECAVYNIMKMARARTRALHTMAGRAALA